MGDRLDRMRAAASNPPVAVPRVTVPEKRPPGIGKLVPPPGGATAPAPAVVTFACGHARPCEVLKNKKCPKCVEEETAKQHRAAREARERRFVKERLPAGASKLLRWDGTVWRGEMTIDGVPELFVVEAPSEIACCRMLHARWKKWERENRPPGGTQ